MAREESRWGLYHERADVPQRDDDAWFFHLNVRRRRRRVDGVPASGRSTTTSSTCPSSPRRRPSSRGCWPSSAPRTAGRRPPAGRVPQVGRPAAGRGRPGPRGCWSCSPSSRAPRRPPSWSRSWPTPTPTYGGPRSRRSPRRRRRARRPCWCGRSTTPSRPFEPPPRPRCASWSRCCPRTRRPGRPCRGARANGDPVVRAAVLDVLRALELGDEPLFREALGDADPAVRLQAVRGLVSVDSVPGVALAAGDSAREVRIAVAHGLGRLARLVGGDVAATRGGRRPAGPGRGSRGGGRAGR